MCDVGNLQEYRREIDRINSDIVILLGDRVGVARKIGRLKKKEGAQVVDNSREKEVFEKVMKSAGENGVDKDYVKDIFELIIKNSRDVQE